MARRRRPATAHQQPKPVAQERGHASRPERVDMPSRQLDRQRQPVQTAADIGDDRRIPVAQLIIVDIPGYALDEQLNGRESQRLDRR